MSFKRVFHDCSAFGVNDDDDDDDNNNDDNNNKIRITMS